MPDELTSLTARMVRIDSVNPALDPSRQGEGELARFVAGWCAEQGLAVRWLESVPGRPSVIVTAEGSGGGRSLLLNAHLDTVGVSGMAEPFAPTVRDGRMYGRGVMDMKASLAACLSTLAHARGQGLRGDVVLTAVADEEHDSIGTRETLADLSKTGVRVDAAIVTEPSDLDIHVAHRGFSVFTVELEGKASHTSRPEAGVNALVHLGRLLASVEREAAALRSRPPHPLLAHGSLQPVLANGGHELFTTPAQARLTLERRTLPGESPSVVEAELEALLEELASSDPTFKARCVTEVAREPFEAVSGSEIERVLSAAVEAVCGTPPKLLGAPYWTDAALVAQAGIPTLLLGPVGGGIHQVDEWVDLASVADLHEVLNRVVEDFCG